MTVKSVGCDVCGYGTDGDPHTIVIGDRNLDSGVVEYKYRRSEDKSLIALDDVVSVLKEKIITA